MIGAAVAHRQGRIELQAHRRAAHEAQRQKLHSLLNQYGVARKTAAAWAAEHFPDYDGDVAAVIGSCYANTGEHGIRSLVRRGEDDEKFATVADIEQFLSEQAKFRKNTVSGKFEVLMADCGEEYAELTDRYHHSALGPLDKKRTQTESFKLQGMTESNCR